MSRPEFLNLEDLVKYYPLLIFVFLWLMVTAVSGLLSGWYFLVKKYPDREDEALLKVKRRWGKMGLIKMRGALNISVCQSGLRIGINRLFGIFCSDFFVPWAELTVERKRQIFFEMAVLKFGRPAIGNLKISASLADRLARSALGQWPEPGPFPEITDEQLASGLIKVWLLAASFGALFFIVVPRLASPERTYPPVIVAILFPAFGFGLLFLIEYLRNRRK